jgi:hypothetical protein
MRYLLMIYNNEQEYDAMPEAEREADFDNHYAYSEELAAAGNMRGGGLLVHLLQVEKTDVPAGIYAEAVGLLALMLLNHARRHARLSPTGEFVRLTEQDRSRWDQLLIGEGLALRDKALSLRQAGRYQIQAAISAIHAQAPTAEATDRKEIVGLYAMLRRIHASNCAQPSSRHFAVRRPRSWTALSQQVASRRTRRLRSLSPSPR